VDPKDRALGMDRSISRRDFLNGVAVSLGAAMLPPHLLRAWGSDPEKAPDYYPPALTGLRGSHPGSFEIAHSLRDGTFWADAGTPIDTGESYDLAIVGGGISGLSAASYFRKVAGPNARILILENHDDFGGHAKRNEFRVGNRTLLGYGGSYSVESPAPYSAVAKSLIKELGIDVGSYSKYVDRALYSASGRVPKIFFDKENFGVDKLVDDPAPFSGGETADLAVPGPDAWKNFMANAPLSDQARKDIWRLNKEPKDYLPGLSSDQKKDRLARMSYTTFLTDLAGVHPEVIRLYQAASHPLAGAGIDIVPAQDAWGLGYPGFEGLKLDPTPGKGMDLDAIANDEAEQYFFHFPDGNASIARLLVRQLIPEAMPGKSAIDIVTARTNYARLDEKSSSIRIRLNSTAVRVKHVGDPSSAKEVEIVYAHAGKVYSTRAKNCILACWHVVIPYICEELPESQKEALAAAAKIPLLYTNVVLRNWTSFDKLKANSIYSPGSYCSHVDLDLPVSMGDYKYPRRPEEPIVVHTVRTPCRPGRPARDQYRIGRMELFATSFDAMERKIRDQLARMLGPGEFDPARDILAITANRWPHGYTYQYSSLYDKFWLEGGPTPCELARKPFGRVAIANADAAAYAYVDAAIDQAHRAVQEITKEA
jgi:spermidine dehydrogenase